MNIHIIQHEIFEASGAYLDWAVQKQHNVTFSRVFENEPLPDSVARIDMLIIMGGPQSPDTTIRECPHFDAPAEMDLIRKCIDAQKRVIGVCLGAQLIGSALGAPHERSPEKEIGNFPILLTQEGRADKKLAHFTSPIVVGHWHGDMPGLTETAAILAYSTGCPRQIVAYSPNVYAFQCHMELTREVVGLLIGSEAGLDEMGGKHRFVQSAEELMSHDYSAMNQALFAFLDQFTAQIGAE